MIAKDRTLEDLTVTINQEIHVQAPLETTFAALLEQLGPGNETPDGKSLSLRIEPWPGGRWYRDLGDGNGHFWVCNFLGVFNKARDYILSVIVIKS